MFMKLVERLDALEPELPEHEVAFHRANYQGEYRRLKFVLYGVIALTVTYMFKEGVFQLIRHHAWPLLTVRSLMIVLPVILLIVQWNTVEPVLNKPLMLALAALITFNQVLTAIERPLEYPFTSHTSILVLFILYFVFPFRLTTRMGFALAMSLAESAYIIYFKTYEAGGKFTVLVTYVAFNVMFSYWSASLNTMRRKSFMDFLRIQEAKEQSDLLYRTLSHDIRAPFAGLLMESGRLTQALEVDDAPGMRTITGTLRATLLSTWAMTENLLEWSQLSGFKRIDPPETFLLADIINETLGLFQPVVDHRGLAVELSLEDGLSVRANGRAVRVLARNLVHNACKFSADKGCLRIRTHLGEEGTVLLRVFNDGVPLPASISDAAMAANQIDSTAPERRSGARLGLGISFNLAAQNGWELRLGPVQDTDGVTGTEAVLSLPGGYLRAHQE
jgi:signal transduction histidine kinase